jgi:hypothetical protein
MRQRRRNQSRETILICGVIVERMTGVGSQLKIPNRKECGMRENEKIRDPEQDFESTKI